MQQGNYNRASASAAVFAVFFVCLRICAASQFHSNSYGYKLDLPDGWVAIPQDILQEVLVALQKQKGAAGIIYDAGFQLDSAERWLEYPYVLVQPLPYSKFGIQRQLNEDEFPKYVRSITGLDVDKLVEENIPSDARHLLGPLSVGKAQLDASNRRFFWTMNMDVQGVGPVRGLIVGYFGRDSIVQVAFYARNPDWDHYNDVRLAIVDSFRFDSQKAYSPQAAATNTPASRSRTHDPFAGTSKRERSSWSRIIEKGAAGGIVGGLFAFVAAVIAMRRRRKSGTLTNAAKAPE